ncbi:MAG: aldo/keto reductase [Myxococcota bacterium]
MTVDGVEVPPFLYGTAWKEQATEGLVRQALAAGFRGIDTANQRKHYHEAGVGAGIRDFLAEHGRDALFLQTKFTFRPGQDERLPYDPAAPVAEQVRQSFASSLEHLGVAHLDSLVLHGPSQREGLGPDDLEAWQAMEALHDAGQVRLLGVSNVSAAQLEALWAQARVKPRFVQSRCFAVRGWNADIRAVCRERGIVCQGFSLLTANRDVWGHPVTSEVAAAHGMVPAQLIFALALRLGMLPLTGSSDPEHLALDLAELALEVPDAALERVLALSA